MTVSFLPVAEPFQMQKEGIRGVEVQVLWMAIQVPVNLSAKKSTFRPPPTKADHLRAWGCLALLSPTACSPVGVGRERILCLTKRSKFMCMEYNQDDPERYTFSSDQSP